MQDSSPRLPLVIRSPKHDILEKNYPPPGPFNYINGELARSLYIDGAPAFAVENGDRKAVSDSAENHDLAKEKLTTKLGGIDSIFISSLFQGIEIYAIANDPYIQIEMALAKKSEDLMVTMRQDNNNGILNLVWEKEKSILVATLTVGMNFVRYDNEKLPDHIELTVKINVQKDELSNKPKLSREISVVCNFSNKLLEKMQSLEIFNGLQIENISKLISSFITAAIQPENVAENKFKLEKKLFKSSLSTGTKPPKKPSSLLQGLPEKKPAPIPPKGIKQKITGKVSSQSKTDNTPTDFFKNPPTAWIRVNSFVTTVLLKYQQPDPSLKYTKEEKAKEITLESQKVAFSERLGTKISSIRYRGFDGYELAVPATQAQSVAKKIQDEVASNLSSAFEQNKKDAANIPNLLKDVENLLKNVLDSAPNSSQVQPEILHGAWEVLHDKNWEKLNRQDITEIKEILEKLKTQQTRASKKEDKLLIRLTQVVNALSTTYTLNISQQPKEENRNSIK